MAYNKVILGNTTLVDMTDATATASDILTGATAYIADGTLAVGTATQGGSVIVTEEIAPGGGIIKHITAEVLRLQNKTATPTETAQSITPDTGYNGLSRVTVGAIDSDYVGSGITRRSSSDLTVSGAQVTAPAGYYSASASKSVASGTAGTPTASKGTVSNHSVSVTPSVTNITGYITGGTKTGTVVTVSASELVSGTLTVSETGTKDVTNYASVNVDIDFITYYTGSSTPSSSLGSDGDIYLKVAS